MKMKPKLELKIDFLKGPLKKIKNTAGRNTVKIELHVLEEFIFQIMHSLSEHRIRE